MSAAALIPTIHHQYSVAACLQVGDTLQLCIDQSLYASLVTSRRRPLRAGGSGVHMQLPTGR